MKRLFSIFFFFLCISAFGLYAAFEDVAVDEEPVPQKPAPTVKTQKPVVPVPVVPTVKTQKPVPTAVVPPVVVPPVPVVVTPPPLDLNTLKFNKEIAGWRYKNWDADMAEVGQKIRIVMAAVKPLIDKLPADKKIMVVGYADGIGPENPEGEEHPGNIAIGERRATAVVDFIVKNYGISRDRFQVSSKGGTDLKYPADPGAAANRRVIIKFEP